MDPSAWGQEVREERIGILEGPAAHGDDAKGERRLPAHHVQWEARVPSPAWQSDPGGQIHAPMFPHLEPSCWRYTPQGVSKPWKAV